MTDMRQSRRRFLKSVAAIAAFPAPAIAQGAAPHVVIIGGGFGGASCARALRKAGASIRVTLIGTSESYFAPPYSNAVIAGLVDTRHQTFSYDGLRAAGIEAPPGAATAVDPIAKTVMLRRDGTSIRYDRLVISPGIELRKGFIASYDDRAMAAMPAAYNNAGEVSQLRAELQAMEDGGTVVISSPVNPARCPPAPYERASLIAYYLKTKKPKSKVIVLDAKESFTMQRLFEAAWQELYPGLIEWVGLSQGGALSEVDVRTKTLSTDFDKYKANVASIIPPQQAGRIAKLAGVVDRTGWCPVDPVTFESTLQKSIHVIGDAAIAGAMPRSASAANSQAKICAAAIVKLLAGETPDTPTLTSSCFSLISPDYAISQRGSYRPVDGQYNEADGGPVVSPISATPDVRKNEAQQASAWFDTITGEVFG